MSTNQLVLGSKMCLLCTLQSNHNGQAVIGYDFHAYFKEIAGGDKADVCIVSTEDGFSPLGTSHDFFASDLGIPVAEIKRLADWNRFENERVTLVALSSRRNGGLLRGILLAPGETAHCYERFATPIYGRPHRDFYYNVSYEAIAYACQEWGARKLAISHLSGCGTYHEDIATCHAEALAHYCDNHPETAPDSFAFCGCCIRVGHLDGIRRLNAEGDKTIHRPISVSVESEGDVKLIHLSWQMAGL